MNAREAMEKIEGTAFAGRGEPGERLPDIPPHSLLSAGGWWRWKRALPFADVAHTVFRQVAGIGQGRPGG